MSYGGYTNTLLAPRIEAITTDHVSSEQIYHLNIKLVNTNIDNTVIITK